MEDNQIESTTLNAEAAIVLACRDVVVGTGCERTMGMAGSVDTVGMDTPSAGLRHGVKSVELSWLAGARFELGEGPFDEELQVVAAADVNEGILMPENWGHGIAGAISESAAAGAE